MNDKLELFFSQFPLITFKKSEHILHSNQIVGQVCFIKTGIVRQYTISKQGTELTLNIFQPGSLLFFLHTLNDKVTHYHYQAISKSEIYVAPFSKTLNFLKSDPDLTLDILRQINLILDSFMIWVEKMILCCSREKIATMLYILAKKFGQKNGSSEILITLPLTHYDLACLVGLSREKTSIELKKMERKKIIRREKQYTIISNLEIIEKIATKNVDHSSLDYSHYTSILKD